MINASCPISDAARVTAPDATYLLDTEMDEMFDRLTRLGARALDVPTAFVLLIDKDRRLFKSFFKSIPTETLQDRMFCELALDHHGVLVIPDTLSDSRFANSSLIAEIPSARFYAQLPLYSRDRRKIGAFCVVDCVPRALTEEDVRILKDLARSAEELIYQQQLALASRQLLETLRAQDDISVRLTRSRQEVEHVLHYDGLTGLPNRTRLFKKLNQGIRRWKQASAQGMVAYIDLDAFRNFNSELGYQVADLILQRLGQRLVNHLSPSDTVARIGSDEFVIVLDLPDSVLPGETVLARVAERIRQPLQIDGHELVIGCTIGFAQYPRDGNDAGHLLVAANAAMHESKRAGRGTIRQCRTAPTPQTNGRFFLESGLRQALHNGELSLHYQPKVSLRTGRVVGVEALVRWQHPGQGAIPPAQFIPIAEQTGLIVPIGEWVLHTACQQVRSWLDQGLGVVPVAVNLSSRQFLSNDISGTVDRVMRAANIEAGMLELELTEGLSMYDPKQSISLMHKLKKLGVAMSIDDFGTGYSSLSYLKRLPIDKIKIDRSFVVDMTENAESLSMVQAIIAMAHRLNLKVVAEGVETEKQLSFLTLNLCDEMQGYFFSRPLPAEQCTDLLASGRVLDRNQSTGPAIAALFSCR